MKKIRMILLILSVTGMILSGCASAAPATVPDAGAASGDTKETAAVTVADAGEASASEDTNETSAPEEAATENAVDSDTEEISQPKTPDTSASVKGQPIVWLGDSLTQGSLGDKNDNLPGAPYEKLKTLVNVPVEGYGYYGWNTHDVLWYYTASEGLGQKADPNKTYIFWLGSNDWVVDGEPNSNTAPVIAEIDRFLHLEGEIKNYIVIGTTSRHRLGDLYVPINSDLAAHYNIHYMDVIDIINKYGYSEDNTHLSQASYDAIAVAVFNKLKALGYI